jgi:heme-degrading monooxygenase HmoA
MVVLINCFEVPASQEARFFALWKDVNAYMVAKPGYRSHRLHRSLSPDAHFRFVNFAEWESAEHLQAAHDDGFRQLLADPQWQSFGSTRSVYEAFHVGPQH